MQRREQHILRFWCFVRIFPDHFSFRRSLANFLVCHELLDLLSVISEANATAPSVSLKYLGSKIAEKKDAPYSQTIGWRRCHQ